MKKVYLSRFARALPPRKVENAELEKYMETTDEWIQKRSGIQSRYWVDEGITTSSLGVSAAKETLSNTNSSQVDALIAATLSPDYNFPGIGVQIQDKLELGKIPAYDIRNQCSGFLYGVEMGGALIQTGVYNTILLVGAEVHSTGLDVSTRGRNIAVLFGDGAGSCLLSSERSDGIDLELIGTELHSDGAYAEELWCQHPGSAPHPQRITAKMVEDGEVYPEMNGRLVFEHAVKAMSEVSKSLLAKHKLATTDITLFVPHQANIRINQMVGKMLDLEEHQVFSTIQEYGNTTAATIPIGISRAMEERELNSGDYVLSAAFGSGFTWGAALFRVA